MYHRGILPKRCAAHSHVSPWGACDKCGAAQQALRKWCSVRSAARAVILLRTRQCCTIWHYLSFSPFLPTASDPFTLSLRGRVQAAANKSEVIAYSRRREKNLLTASPQVMDPAPSRWLCPENTFAAYMPAMSLMVLWPARPPPFRPSYTKPR